MRQTRARTEARATSTSLPTGAHARLSSRDATAYRPILAIQTRAERDSAVQRAPISNALVPKTNGADDARMTIRVCPDRVKMAGYVPPTTISFPAHAWEDSVAISAR